MRAETITEILERVARSFNEKSGQRRSVVMDVFQGLLEESPQWPLLRKKLLSYFGESGVQGDLQRIIDDLILEQSHSAHKSVGDGI